MGVMGFDIVENDTDRNMPTLVLTDQTFRVISPTSS